MISNIDKALREGRFFDDVFLSLTDFNFTGETLILTFDVTYEDDREVLQKWEVQCIDFREHRFDLYYFEEFEVLEEHSMLWKYNLEKVDLFFKGKHSEINKLIGELYLKHNRITNGNLPLDYFINVNKNGNGDLEWLLNCGQGLFSKAPENLTNVYSEILNNYGIKTSIIPWGTKNKDTGDNYKIFEFGESFVVAKRFEANQIK